MRSTLDASNDARKRANVATPARASINANVVDAFASPDSSRINTTIAFRKHCARTKIDIAASTKNGPTPLALHRRVAKYQTVATLCHPIARCTARTVAASARTATYEARKENASWPTAAIHPSRATKARDRPTEAPGPAIKVPGRAIEAPDPVAEAPNPANRMILRPNAKAMIVAVADGIGAVAGVTGAGAAVAVEVPNTIATNPGRSRNADGCKPTRCSGKKRNEFRKIFEFWVIF